MKPIHFWGQTKILHPSKGMTDEKCDSLPVYSDGEKCISCWKMTLKERMKAFIFGKIWIYVLSGNTQPPIAVVCDRTVFEKKKSDE